MKKKIEWVLVQGDGKRLYSCRTREAARFGKKDYDESIFEEWVHDVTFPIKIVREEWQLIGEKVVG